MSRAAFKDKYGVWPDLKQYGAWLAYTENLAAYQAELGKQELASQIDKLARYRSASAVTTMRAKCPCCGSRQYVYRQTARICAYCRSEQ